MNANAPTERIQLTKNGNKCNLFTMRKYAMGRRAMSCQDLSPKPKMAARAPMDPKTRPQMGRAQSVPERMNQSMPSATPSIKELGRWVSQPTDSDTNPFTCFRKVKRSNNTGSPEDCYTSPSKRNSRWERDSCPHKDQQPKALRSKLGPTKSSPALRNKRMNPPRMPCRSSSCGCAQAA